MGLPFLAEPPQASSQVTEQIEVLLKVDSREAKASICYCCFFPGGITLTPTCGHRDGRGNHAACLSFGYTVLLPNRGMSRPYAEKLQMHCETLSLFSIFAENKLSCKCSDTSFIHSTTHWKRLSPDHSFYIFHHSKRFSSILQEAIIPVLPKRSPPSST